MRSPAPFGDCCPVHVSHRYGECIPIADAAFVNYGLGPVWIVKSQNGRLRENVRATQAAGMFWISFDLRGPAHIAFHQQAGRYARKLHRCRVEKRFAGMISSGGFT